MSLYQLGMVVQKVRIEGSENSEIFSRYDESFTKDLRTLAILKLPLHSSVNENPEERKSENPASKNI